MMPLKKTSPLWAFFLLIIVSGCLANPTDQPMVILEEVQSPTISISPTSTLTATHQWNFPLRTPLSENTPTKITATPTTQQSQEPFGLNSCSKKPVQTSKYAPVYLPEVCVYEYNFPLSRPIEPPGNSNIEINYRYGSTQNGERDPHHGVDFINPAGVPVLAAADGVVVIAGTDEENIMAEKRGFYGNLVVIKHDLPEVVVPIYTLYGHLLNFEVKVGEIVEAGRKIGEVGLGGVAAGTHLHFEVRWELNDYNSTRNPELWLTPSRIDRKLLGGVFSGRFWKADEKYLEISNIVLELLEEDELDGSDRIYLKTYEDKGMIGQLPWKESFGIGDLYPGRYRLSFIEKRPIEYVIEIFPGTMTFVTFWLD